MAEPNRGSKTTPAKKKPAPDPKKKAGSERSPAPERRTKTPEKKPAGDKKPAAGDKKPAAGDKKNEKPRGEGNGWSRTRGMLKHSAMLAEECDAAAILVYLDAVTASSWKAPARVADRVIYVAKTAEEQEEHQALGHRVIRVPRVILTRMGQVKVAVFLALSHGLVRGGDRLVCLAGVAASGTLDTILLMEVGQEFEMFLGSADEDVTAPELRPEVLARVVELAVDLGSEGREGRPVGTLFVVGDSEKVLALSRQRILNPFHGYPEDKRNILDDGIEDTIKELSTVDGSFVIQGDGVVLSAGTYLKTSALPEESMPRGMGARHQAAAGITYATDCFAIAVSESTGTVTVFRNGRIVTEIEKPHRSRPEAGGKGSSTVG